MLGNGNIEVKEDNSNNKKTSFNSKEMKEEDSGLFYFPTLTMYQVKSSKDENFNNNVVSFKENISPIESIESCKICTDEKY